MSTFPPGAPNFQLPRPYRGVVYFDDGRLVVMIDGRKVVDHDLAAATQGIVTGPLHVTCCCDTCLRLAHNPPAPGAAVSEAQELLERLETRLSYYSGQGRTPCHESLRELHKLARAALAAAEGVKP